MKKSNKKEEVKIPVCAICNKEVDEDQFCFGCNHYVCIDCDPEGSRHFMGGDHHNLKGKK